jgi:oligopeptide transport system substrate-binding protein
MRFAQSESLVATTSPGQLEANDMRAIPCTKDRSVGSGDEVPEYVNREMGSLNSRHPPWLAWNACFYVSVALALSGCEPSAPRNSESLAAPTAEQHILRRGIGPEPDSLDPQKARTSEAQVILRDVFECLTSVDQQGHPAAGGAESWSTSPDGRTYTFTLRANARWSNGDPVTGGDYVAGLRRLADPSTASENGELIEVIHNARAVLSGKMTPEQLGVSSPDPTRVIVALDHPAPYILSILSHPSTCPVHQSSATTKIPGRPWQVISNGPFAVDQWIPGDTISLRRNSFYWSNSKTYWDKVIYFLIPDLTAELARYRTGELQVTRGIPRSDFAMIQAKYGQELRVWPGHGVYFYGFNLDRPPFRDNLKLRQALNLAIDREQLAQSLLLPSEVATYDWVPPTVDHYISRPSRQESLPRAQRLTLARQLLKQAGYSASRPLSFELKYNTGELHARLAIVVVDMWKQNLGIEIQLFSEEFHALMADIDAGRVDMFRSAWDADYNDPLAFLEILRSDSGMNMMHYRNPHFDQLLDQASLETDLDRRAQILARAEEEAMADVPVIPLYFTGGAHLVKPEIRGLHENAFGVVYSKDLSLSDRASGSN